MAREKNPDEPFLFVAETKASPAKSYKGRSMFVGQNGIRAGWRFALFLAILAVLRTVVMHGLRLIPPFLKIAKATQTRGVLTPEFQLIFQSATVLMVLLSVGIMGKIEKQSFNAYGLS